jgi:hypothetical protein
MVCKKVVYVLAFGVLAVALSCATTSSFGRFGSGLWALELWYSGSRATGVLGLHSVLRIWGHVRVLCRVASSCALLSRLKDDCTKARSRVLLKP